MGPATLQIRGFRLLCICGANPEEFDRPQPYELDLDVVGDINASTESDRLDQTLDYGGILDRVAAVAADETFQLFERMAMRFAEAAMVDDRITEVTIEIRKLRPPVPQDLASAGIRVTRVRS